MEYLSLIATVSTVHILGLISPGPDFIMAIKNSLTYSRKTGIWTSVGFGLGISVHLFYCIAGLALLISKSDILFTTIKFLGSGYLIYIGVMSLTSKSANSNIASTNMLPDISKFQAIKSGFITNILNPKATLFFLSIFSFVVAPETPKYVLAIISFIMIATTILWFSLVSVFFSIPKITNVFNKSQKVLNSVLGVLLISVGVMVVLK
ncbi:MAG: LysE family transporter [Ichthyobacteriaceae bacterium]|nr:LysE family transporter [Ichthyobacteriaceae bacterium]